MALTFQIILSSPALTIKVYEHINKEERRSLWEANNTVSLDGRRLGYRGHEKGEKWEWNIWEDKKDNWEVERDLRDLQDKCEG